MVWGGIIFSWDAISHMSEETATPITAAVVSEVSKAPGFTAAWVSEVMLLPGKGELLLSE